MMKSKNEKTPEELEKEKKEQSKTLLINTINKKGFLLEDRTWNIFNNTSGLRALGRGIIPKKYPYSEGDRIEIDVFGIVGNTHFIVECKHTDYSWIFPKSLDRPNILNIIHNFTNKQFDLIIHSRPTSDFKVAFSDLCIMFDKESFIKKEKGSEYAQTSYKDIHEHIRQILKNLKVYLYEYKNANWGYFMPVIVTNADLYFLDYEEKDVDEKGDIINFKSLEKIPYIIYNFSEILGFPFLNNEEQMKSIFIVNINHLEEAIRLIADQQIGRGRN